MKRELCVFLLALLLGGVTGASVVVSGQDPEAPWDYRERVIGDALAKPAGEVRCKALGELFHDDERECSTDIDCEAKEAFNAEGCCWNDGLPEPKGC